jgi:hypothetical protein
MSRTYSQIIELASQILQDSGNAVYSTTELDLYLPQVISEISRSIPNEIKITKTTDGTTRNLTLTSGDKWKLVNLICAEYIVDRYPKNLRNIKRFGNTVELQINALPSADETVYLYAGREHILQKEIGTTDTAGAVKTAGSAGDTSLALKSLGTGTVNEGTTLTITGDSTVYYVISTAAIDTNEATVSIYPPLSADVDVDTVVTLSLTESTLESSELENIAAEWLAGLAAVNKTNLFNLQINTAITQAANAATAIALVQDRTAQAIADIVDGRTEGAKAVALIASAGTAIGNISARLTQAITDINSGRTEADKVSAVISSGATALSGVAAQIAAAITDIGLSKLATADAEALIATATSIIDSITTSISTAAGYITTNDLTALGLIPNIILSARTELDKVAAVIAKATTTTSGYLDTGKTTADLLDDTISGITGVGGLLADVDTLMELATTASTGDIALAKAEASKAATLIDTDANAAIDLIDAEVDAAKSALASGLSLANTVTVGGGAPEYIQQAQADLNVAIGYWNEALGFLEQSKASQGLHNTYTTLANTDLNAALTKLKSIDELYKHAQSQGNIVGTYLGLATGAVNSANAILRHADSLFKQAQANETYASACAQACNSLLSVARTYLNQANSYIAAIGVSITVSNSYLAIAGRDINAGIAKIQEADGFFKQAAADGNISNNYQVIAAREINAGLSYLNHGKALLAQAREDQNLNITYLQTAAKELQAGQTDISEAVASMRLITSRISITAGGRYMQVWGESKIKEAQNNLRRLAGYKTSQVYSRS